MKKYFITFVLIFIVLMIPVAIHSFNINNNDDVSENTVQYYAKYAVIKPIYNHGTEDSIESIYLKELSFVVDEFDNYYIKYTYIIDTDFNIETGEMNLEDPIRLTVSKFSYYENSPTSCIIDDDFEKCRRKADNFHMVDSYLYPEIMSNYEWTLSNPKKEHIYSRDELDQMVEQIKQEK